jgi:excisionase family DNA binding protein
LYQRADAEQSESAYFILRRINQMEHLRDVKAAAEVLAVSPWTVRAWIRDGKLRPVRLGRLVRLAESELQRFMAEAQGVTLAQQTEEAK